MVAACPPAGEPSEAVLEVRGLRTWFEADGAVVKAVDGVDLAVSRGECVALVGESGCGKSVTALSVMRLVPSPPGKTVGGRILFKGRDLVQCTDAEIRELRGNDISMIFQEPMTALNPVFTVGYQVAEVIRAHQRLRARAARRKALEVLEMVGVPDVEERYHAYPHELSVGLRQRIMIAMALACRPSVLVADEPTTALDVTIQAQILDLLARLQQDLGMATLLITHDLGVVAGMCDRVMVMYAGRIVEEASTRDLYASPSHPYTKALLESVPRLDEHGHARLQSIEGLPPRLDRGAFDACTFAPRCTLARDACRAGEPPLEAFAPGRRRRCVLTPEEVL